MVSFSRLFGLLSANHAMYHGVSGELHLATTLQEVFHIKTVDDKESGAFLAYSLPLALSLQGDARQDFSALHRRNELLKLTYKRLNGRSAGVMTDQNPSTAPADCCESESSTAVYKNSAFIFL